MRRQSLLWQHEVLIDNNDEEHPYGTTTVYGPVKSAGGDIIGASYHARFQLRGSNSVKARKLRLRYIKTSIEENGEFCFDEIPIPRRESYAGPSKYMAALVSGDLRRARLRKA